MLVSTSYFVLRITKEREYTIQVKIHIWGGGLNVPLTKVGVSILMGAVIKFRASPTSLVTVLAIRDVIGAGSGKGTFILGSAKTDWMNIDSSSQKWINDLQSLVGTKGEIAVSGTTIGSGTSDVTFNKIDKDNDLKPLFKKYHVKTDGFQITETKIRGKILFVSRSVASRNSSNAELYS